MNQPQFDPDNRREQRNFGLVMAGALVVVMLIRWAITHDWAVWFLYIAIAFLIPAVVYPKVLKPVFIVWMKFARAINFVMINFLLSLIWLLIITPTRIFMSLTGKDLLNRKMDSDAASYWEDAEPASSDLDDYKNHF